MKCVNCDLPVAEGQRECACGTKIDEKFITFAALLERAESGDAKAQCEAAIAFQNGTQTIKENLSKSKRFFQAAYNQGEALGYYGIGWFHLHGYADTQIDYEKTQELAQKAIAMNCVEGIRLMGHLYREEKWPGHNDAEAVKWYCLAAERRDARAQAILGWMYEHGRGAAKSDTEAVKWYRLAADQGDAWAQTNMGVMYSNGRGVAKSDTEAVKWYRLAVDHGEAIAQTNLGLMYENGRGVAKDIGMAKELMIRAARADSCSYNQLGWFYKRQGMLEDALSSWYSFHKENAPEEYNNQDIPDWYERINRHLFQELVPRMHTAKQRFLYYAPCRVITNYREDKSMTNGYSYIHRFGDKGIGYFALTDQGVYICKLNSVSKKYNYQNVHPALLILGNTTEHYLDSNSDAIEQISYRRIQNYSINDSACLVLTSGSQTAIRLYFLDDEKMIMSAISMGQNGMFERLKSEESPKQEGNISNQSFEDPIERLKKLKQLLDTGILNQEEYEQHKEKLLQEMGL